MRTEEGLEALRAMIQAQQACRYRAEYPKVDPPRVTVKPGKRWVKIDVGTSGTYMVDRDGTIYGIKGYGVPHLGYQYGTLDTIKEWDWSGYAAVRRNGSHHAD
jgi:hypothetical protein